MTKITTVDAISSTPVTPKAAMNMVSVPLKLDASSLAKALQESAAQTTRVANPAELIKNSAARMAEMYDRFNTLKQLGAELNGKALTDPIPASLQIEDISITFRAVKDGKAGDAVKAVIKNVICVGDIAGLLSGELGTLILSLQQEAAAIKETAKTAEETCGKARETWEASNPDKRISLVDQNTAEESADKPQEINASGAV